MPAAYRDSKPWSGKKYRANRLEVLAESDLCGICGHHGAQTIDHIIPLAAWPKDEHGRLLPGHDAKENLQPAHGTTGAGANRIHNPCPTCGQLCNQRRGKGQPQQSPRSRIW